MRYRLPIVLLTGLVLAGCEDLSLKEAECHNMSEDRMDLYSDVASPDEKKAAEKALFNKCMSEENGFQYEVDNRNAMAPGQVAPYAPDRIIMTDQPPLVPPAHPQLQPYTSPNRELLNILTKGY